MNELKSQDRLSRQFAFIKEIDREKQIGRQTYLADASRKENDAEHAWHLAVMCMLLCEYSNESIDVLRTMSMLLVHDLVEIDAGDTYAYDDEGNATKREREQKAADRIFSILPEDQGGMIRKLWEEYEEEATPEARFAHCIDNLQPMMLNDASGGKGWREHGVSLSQILGRNRNTGKGSQALWEYARSHFIKPNVESGNIKNDNIEIDSIENDSIKSGNSQKEDIQIEQSFLQERCILAKERLEEVAMLAGAEAFTENPGIESYFAALAAHMSHLFHILSMVQTGGLYELPLETLQELNSGCYCAILKGNYENSVYRPAALVSAFGRKMGQYLSLLSAEVQGVTPYAYEGNMEELTRVAELLLEVFLELSSLQEELGNEVWKDSHAQQSVHDILYYYVSDYCTERMEQRARQMLLPSESFLTDFIMKSDFSDIRYLYYLGEYVSPQEIETVEYLISLPKEVLKKAAAVCTRGYRDGFTVTGVAFEGKKTVNIRYRMGFEPLIREMILQFEEMGLKPVIYRAQMMTTVKHPAGKIGFSSSSANLQFDYDHRFDEAVYLNKAFIERKLAALDRSYEKLKEEAKGFGGPAVIEVFGENQFEPERNEACNQLSAHQQQLKVEYAARSGEIANRYMPSEQCSYTIVAYPVPEIGKEFGQIFMETLELNSLPSDEYRNIQQSLIDALDSGDSVRVCGMNGNETDLTIRLHPLKNPEKETNFENCLADVNIPLGEVFTSPLLTGTNGLLHVKKVFLNGLEYSNLKLTFSDGMIAGYTCDNFPSDEENRKCIKEQILYQHESLPLGEFAIGTNTKAYAMARKYGIERKLPILIAEKTGPHFAVGDTCYSRAEEHAVYNPDGKEIIARENECSMKRHDNPKEAYFNCHTDITIPYDELGEISVYRNEEKQSVLLSEGKFVLAGTEELNRELCGKSLSE